MDSVFTAPSRMKLYCSILEETEQYCSYGDHKAPTWQITSFANGDSVCSECMREYVSDIAKQHAEDFSEEYIQENLLDRAKYHWSAIADDEHEFNRVILEIYQREKEMEQKCHLDTIQNEDINFCLESDDFIAFIKERLF